MDSIPDPHMCHSLDIVGTTSHTSCQSVYFHLHTGMMLKENNALKELNLGKCGLQPEGSEEVIKGIQVDTKLEILDLSWSTINNKSASRLGKNDIIIIMYKYLEVHLKEL